MYLNTRHRCSELSHAPNTLYCAKFHCIASLHCTALSHYNKLPCTVRQYYSKLTILHCVVQCAICNIECAVCSLQFAVFSVQCAVICVHSLVVLQSPLILPDCDQTLEAGLVGEPGDNRIPLGITPFKFYFSGN